MSEADKIIANVQMAEKKMELEKLVQDIFETGIITHSKRNKFLVNLIIVCVTMLVNFIKLRDVEIQE